MESHAVHQQNAGASKTVKNNLAWGSLEIAKVVLYREFAYKGEALHFQKAPSCIIGASILDVSQLINYWSWATHR